MVKDILSKIVEDKKQEIAVAKQHIPESFFREKAFAPRKRRPFLKKLEQPGPCGINIIAEIKRASPSKGDIRANLNPAVYAGELEQAAVCVIRCAPGRRPRRRPTRACENDCSGRREATHAGHQAARDQVARFPRRHAHAADHRHLQGIDRRRRQQRQRAGRV